MCMSLEICTVLRPHGVGLINFNQKCCWYQYLCCIVLPRSAPRNQLEACGST
jgi:hypothetical protein